MRTHWSLTGCDAQQEADVARLWETCERALDAKLAAASEGPGDLTLAVVRDSETETWRIEAVLYLSTATLMGEGNGPGAEAALAEVVRGLASEIDRKASETDGISRRRTGRESALVPLLERYHAQQNARAFLTVLRPLMRSLKSHALQELRILRLEGVLHAGQITVTDVLDTAMLSAWQGFADRPRQRPLDVWLAGVIDDVVAALAGGETFESLDRRVRLPTEEPRSSRTDLETEQPTYPETIELGELLEGHAATDAWDRLDVETKQLGLSMLLAGLPRRQRQAVIYAIIEGFEPVEIADIQDRSREEVLKDIDEGCKAIARQFRDREFLSQIEADLQRRRGQGIRRTHRH